MWSVSDENASVRGRSGPDKGLPAIGASALAGREGRLRTCMRDVQWFLLAFISSQVLNCQLLNRGGPFGVPVQWLTTTHKTPCVRGDGSRSGPSPCQTNGGLGVSLDMESEVQWNENVR